MRQRRSNCEAFAFERSENKIMSNMTKLTSEHLFEGLVEKVSEETTEGGMKITTYRRVDNGSHHYDGVAARHEDIEAFHKEQCEKRARELKRQRIRGIAWAASIGLLVAGLILLVVALV